MAFAVPGGLAGGWVTGPGLAAMAAVAAAGCLERMRRDGPDTALAWGALLAVVVIEAAAHLIAWWRPGTGVGTVHVVAVGLLAAALAALPGAAAAGRGWRLAGDGLGAGFAFAFLAGRPLLAAIPPSGDGRSAAAAHLLAGVLVGTAAVLVLSRLRSPGGARTVVVVALTLAGLAASAGDIAVLIERLRGTGPLVGRGELGWLVAVTFVAVAARSGPTQDGGDVTPLREHVAVASLVLPPSAVALIAGWLVWRGHDLDGADSVALLGLASAVLLRHAIARMDYVVITRTLEAKVAERTLALVTREQWFRSLVQHSSDVLTVLDEAGIIRYQSPAATRVLGHDPALLLGTSFTFLIRPGDVQRLQQALAEAIRVPRATFVIEFAIWHKEGRWCETETTITSLLDDADIRGLVLNTRDIGERKRLEDALTHQAFHDNLTGLANRVLFSDRVAQALTRARQHSQVAVLFLDLDGFKAVNDGQGHAVGDQLLGLVAERLVHCVRPSDTVARLGGDEFGVLVLAEDCARTAAWIADRVREAITQPFVIDGREICIGVSTGIALNLTAFESADVLLRNADVAMYKSKAKRDGGWVRFEPGMRDALLDRLEMEHDLKLALSRGEFAVYFQPTVELVNGYIVGTEALLRWHHPRRGTVAPEQFIGLAEESGLITAVGEHVLREACRQGVRWQAWAAPGQYFHVAVNISARQLAPGLVETVRQALAESGLPPGALVLEITESLLVERTDEVLALLHQLKALGIRLAIDDFGTGYSSLSYLSRFPVDVLKIDKSFVDAVAARGQQTELANTIIHLGRSLHLSTVAEGIETQAQHATLKAMGCDYGQGFLFARPLPPAGLDELLSCRVVPERPREPTVAAPRVGGEQEPARWDALAL
ncbi:MAG: putative bifunctional diguanylate cyclase/phosphodiesterase [Frankiaceae bacterium]